MKEHKRILVTAALPYANGPVHVGHLAGCYLPADIYVRWERARKKDIVFVGGSDEHGVPITIRAMKEGITPQDVVDKYHAQIKDSFQKLGISFDIYSRTSNKVHHETSSDFFKKLYDDGMFEEKETEQYYDEEKETFLADRYITGTCPICSNPNAYGDQCEKCGTSLSPEQLINPRSTLSNNPPHKRRTKHWYFPLNEFEPFLQQWILEEHKDWKNNVYGQCKSWLTSGLQPRAMTRDSNWGVQVPLPDAEGKVLYVWFDAPIGYISATKELLPDTWQNYWQQEDTKLVHFIGKDNIVFHCIIFPAMLKAHGKYVLPDNVPANEFLNLEGDKVSTSRNWAVWAHEYLQDFEGCEDVLRYYLTTIAPETKDSDFTWKGFQDANNSELVSIFGNFVNRTWVLMHKLCGGKVPPLHLDAMGDEDRNMFNEIRATKHKIELLLEQYKFRDALFEVIDLARKGNGYMQKKEPWIKAKVLADDLLAGKGGLANPEQVAARESIDVTMHVCLQLCANLAIFINPFLPTTARKMMSMMKVVEKMLDWENAGKEKLLSTGYSLRAPELLFRKIEDVEIEKQIEKLKSGPPAPGGGEQEAGLAAKSTTQIAAIAETSPSGGGHEAGLIAKSTAEIAASPETSLGGGGDEAGLAAKSTTQIAAITETSPSGGWGAAKPSIIFDDFAKIDLRIGTIIAAEKVEKADKLLKLTVDLGFETRTIVSGIALHFLPEEIVGKQVTVVVNLAPRKMRGIESQGMILMAEDAEGKLHFLSPQNNIQPGAIIS